MSERIILELPATAAAKIKSDPEGFKRFMVSGGYFVEAIFPATGTFKYIEWAHAGSREATEQGFSAMGCWLILAVKDGESVVMSARHKEDAAVLIAQSLPFPWLPSFVAENPKFDNL